MSALRDPFPRTSERWQSEAVMWLSTAFVGSVHGPPIDL